MASNKKPRDNTIEDQPRDETRPFYFTVSVLIGLDYGMRRALPIPEGSAKSNPPKMM